MIAHPCPSCGRAHITPGSCGIPAPPGGWAPGSAEEQRIADLAERIAVDRFWRRRTGR